MHFKYTNKGNNKMTELQNKISQPLEIYGNRNDPDLAQAFLKQWCVESDFKDTGQVKYTLDLIPKFLIHIFSPSI